MAQPAPASYGQLLAAAGSRWLRIVLAVGILVLLARTRLAPLAYLMLVPAALYIGSPAMRGVLDKWINLWSVGGKGKGKKQ